MRGASRREDMAHWIISLKDATEEDGRQKAFITTFSKCRNCKAGDVPPLRWTLEGLGQQLTLQCATHSGPDAMLGHIRDGTTSASELSELLNVQKGTVSKWAAKLKAAGKITMKGRDYMSVD
jgi:CRP-like cAMP-binding protein